jgi:CheY-like chemotaxis protein/anti-sigma regulatory factor (Ser/Thr protein kinase)
VLGLTEVVLGTSLNPKQHDLLEIVHRSGNSLLEIINDILYLSKIEAGRLDLEAEPFDLRRTVVDAVGLFDLEAQRKGLDLTTHIAPEVGDELVGDPARLRQVLVNLVGNAIKFTEQGRVSIDVVRPRDVAMIDCVEFRVRDTGVGIDDQRLEQLFSPFSQADTSTTRTHGGTGLGLTIAKRLVELMGGELAATGTPGRGSTFVFSVPLARSERAVPADGCTLGPDAAAPSAAALPSALSVLVVEDDAMNRIVTCHMLARLGLDADIAHDGLEAVALATSESYDVILMDVQMPNLDGVGAMRRIRDQLPEDEHPQIVALTANAVEGDRERYLADGMDAYLSKPLRLQELRVALETAVALSEAVPCR